MESDLMLYFGATALGALHAFEPGHGKSIIAAYMIGTRGRAIDGIILGFIVTFTHTFSVILLGLIAKALAGSFTDDQMHTWLGLFSSLLILGVGIWMLRERLSGHNHTHFHFFCKDEGHHAHGNETSVHDHDHHDHGPATHTHEHHDHGPADQVHDHDHATHNHSHDDHHHAPSPHTHAEHNDHHDHDSNHGHQHHSPEEAFAPDGTLNLWRLTLLGVSGGIVPCPPAIAALLAAIGAGRIGQGLTVTLFFSLGLGLVMMTIGVVLSQAGRLTQKIGENLALARKLGIASALLITFLGIYTLYHSLLDIFSS
ncbi:MAG: sulfite exporter TauE/SafE family protein [Proteobacteria bacterium]|nr:sulfite exporter TauE/SafE family protein [Pseudomonadota bacterium]MBU1688650.1 sulfite exporter TauE/SafE family protein [Pseudomonadota bacterium]